MMFKSLTSISGLVALLRKCDMQRWRWVGVRTSGMGLELLLIPNYIICKHSQQFWSIFNYPILETQ